MSLLNHEKRDKSWFCFADIIFLTASSVPSYFNDQNIRTNEISSSIFSIMRCNMNHSIFTQQKISHTSQLLCWREFEEFVCAGCPQKLTLKRILLLFLYLKVMMCEISFVGWILNDSYLLRLHWKYGRTDFISSYVLIIELAGHWGCC